MAAYIRGCTGWIRPLPLMEVGLHNVPDQWEYRVVAPSGEVLDEGIASTREGAIAMVDDGLYHQDPTWEQIR